MLAPNLRELTRPAHHAAEQHPVGAAMADGSISADWWSAWCAALLPVHAVLDLHSPSSIHRTAELIADLSAGPPAQISREALAYARTLTSREAIDGAVYVFTGAHLMGGALIARRIGDRLPTAHLQWQDRRQAITDWSPLRERAELQAHADAGFAAIRRMMDEMMSA